MQKEHIKYRNELILLKLLLYQLSRACVGYMEGPWPHVCEHVCFFHITREWKQIQC